MKDTAGLAPTCLLVPRAITTAVGQRVRAACRSNCTILHRSSFSKSVCSFHRRDYQRSHSHRPFLSLHAVWSTQVPAQFSPSKHRSTQIDVEKTLRGTSDVPTRPVHSPARSRGSPSPTSAGKLQGIGASGRRSATNKAGTVTAADLEPPPVSLYKSDYCANDSDAHHITQLTATKLALETTSEWALLNELERTMVEKEVRNQAALLQPKHKKFASAACASKVQ